MGIDKRAAADALTRWQDILRLRDWDVELQIVRKNWRKSGDIKIDAANKLAVLLLNQHVDEDVEETVLHELVHLRLHPLDRMIDDLLTTVYGSEDPDPKRRFAYAAFMDRLESTTQDLTKALLTASDRKPETVSRRLREAVAREIEGGR